MSNKTLNGRVCTPGMLTHPSLSPTPTHTTTPVDRYTCYMSIWPLQNRMVRKPRRRNVILRSGNRGPYPGPASSNELNWTELDTNKAHERYSIQVNSVQYLSCSNCLQTVSCVICLRSSITCLELNSSILKVRSKFLDATLLLAGDFNLPGVDWDKLTHVPKKPNRKECELLLTIVADHHLDQLNLEPTRKKNILDLVFSSRPDLITSCTTGPGISDHDHLVIVRANIRAKQNKKKPRIIHLFKSADWTSIKEYLASGEESFFQNSPEDNAVEQNWQFLRDLILDCMEKFVPKKKASGRQDLPWMTSTVKQLIRRKQHVYNRAKKSKKIKTGRCSGSSGRRHKVPPRQPTGTTWTHCLRKMAKATRASGDIWKAHGKTHAESVPSNRMEGSPLTLRTRLTCWIISSAQSSLEKIAWTFHPRWNPRTPRCPGSLY